MSDRSVDVLIVGGGPAGASCAAELREAGFGGSVLLCGREPDPPYERPPLSKEYLSSRASRAVPVPDDVELLTRTSVMRLDPRARTAALSTKETVSFDKAVLCTGANVRRLPIDGSQLEGIHYLRTLRNADALREEASGASRVVLVGGSFIACELAATLTTMGVGCAMVFPEERCLSLQFGRRAGSWVQELLTSHGVEVLAGDGVERFEGSGEDVERVVTSSGRSLECDLVVVGVGAVPDVMLARSAGLDLGERGGVRCSATLEASAPGVFAAGDVCEYDSVVHGGRVRVEHHEVAVGQGRVAARNVLGEERPYDDVPYFWSDLADWATLEAVGPAVDGWDDEEVRGSLDDGAFSVLYSKDGRLVAAMSAGRREDLDEARVRIVTEGRAAQA
ncbi:MAG TPA: FAD-dependent oxidoreductase [Solirubrobacteraceae bacterium]|nr:FAD-dependent oxidoreductase [Solirubrobacteraceae bacterium]